MMREAKKRQLLAAQAQQPTPGVNQPSPNYAAQSHTAVPDGYSQQGAGVGEQFQQMQEGAYLSPGAAELAQANNAGYYGGPTGSEGYVSGMLPQVGQAGLGQGTAQSIVGQGMNNVGASNPAAQAYSQFQQNRPEISQDAGLAPYYENAGRQALEGINQNAAARGVYGSSAAMAQGQEALTNLAADRANREADYGLRASGENRAWEGLGGQLAGQQAASQLGWAQGLGALGLGAEQMGLSRQLGGANVAGQLQNMEMGRLGQGFGEALSGQAAHMGRLGQGFGQATQGQTLRDNRIQSMLNNQFQRESLYGPMLAGWGGQAIGQDVDLLTSALGGGVAATTEAQRAAQQQDQQLRADVDTVVGAAPLLGML